MQPIRILHVDDDPDIRDVAGLTLALDPELVVDSVGSGADALDFMAQTMPDLMLLDVMMPDMAGPSLFRRMKADPAMAQLPVVFMTAVSDTKIFDTLVELGAAGIISKPFDPLSLADELKTTFYGCPVD